MNEKLIFSIYLALFAILMATTVIALPVGPPGPISPRTIDRWSAWSTTSVPAMAGNVTEFNTNSSTITRTWQGYSGNITGMIILGNSLNQTLYDWRLASPQGEIYAVRNAATPTWTAIVCASILELETEDTALGVTSLIDQDAVNRTFVVNGSAEATANFGAVFGHPTFYVGSVQVNQDNCPITYLYNSSGQPSDKYREVMLSDGTPNLLYTAFLANNFNNTDESIGYDGALHDFQMIVGENGHGTDTAATDYYFYLELE
jgi:hypothetical protein